MNAVRTSDPLARRATRHSLIAIGASVGLMPFGLAVFVGMLLSALVATSAAEPPKGTPSEQFRVELLAGDSADGTITKLDSAGNVVLTSDAGSRTIPWSDVRRCVRLARPNATNQRVGLSTESAAPPATTPETGRASVVLELRPSGRLAGSDLTLDNERFHWRTSRGKTATAPIDSVARLTFSHGAPLPNKFAWPRAAVDQDRLLLRSDNSHQVIDGLLDQITPQHVVFEFDGKSSRVARERAIGLVLADAQTGSPETATVGEVWLTDGQHARLRSLVLTEQGDLRVALIGGASLEWSWSEVDRIECRSPRIMFLSDLTPLEVTNAPLVTPARRWQADRGVAGKPLRIAGQAFEKGLGVHAPTRLTYLVDGEYETLVAYVGLDDSAGGRGDCQFVITGDGRELWRRRCRGGEAAQVVRISLSGVRRLSLEVEAGEELDLADHADWGDAHLLRSSR